MPRWASVALLLSAFVVGAGCGDRLVRDWESAPGAREGAITVSVSSDHFLDVVVYAGRDGTWHRLGTVTGLHSEEFDVAEGLVSPPGQLRLRVHPIGAAGSGDYVSEVILANPGDVIELTVASRVRMSMWRIRPGS